MNYGRPSWYFFVASFFVATFVLAMVLAFFGAASFSAALLLARFSVAFFSPAPHRIHVSPLLYGGALGGCVSFLGGTALSPNKTVIGNDACFSFLGTPAPETEALGFLGISACVVVAFCFLGVMIGVAMIICFSGALAHMAMAFTEIACVVEGGGNLTV